MQYCAAPTPEAAWLATLRAELGRELELTLVPAEPAVPPTAEIDLYHVAGSPALSSLTARLHRRILESASSICVSVRTMPIWRHISDFRE